MIAPNFCPECGSQVLLTTDELTRCHGCGLDFQVLDDEEAQEAQAAVALVFDDDFYAAVRKAAMSAPDNKALMDVWTKIKEAKS